MLNPRISAISAQDIAAALVSVILTIGVVYLGAVEIEIPATLTAALMACIGWLFGRSAQVYDAKRTGHIVTPEEESRAV